MHRYENFFLNENKFLKSMKANFNALDKNKRIKKKKKKKLEI